MQTPTRNMQGAAQESMVLRFTSSQRE